MIEWRWDQGRILYFQYDVLKEIAKVLLKYDNKNINDDTTAEAIKNDLIYCTGMPFLPVNYKVNRNYSRVFQCAMLATTTNKGILKVSDIGRQMANDLSVFDSPDDYFVEIMNRFRLPYPAFKDYNSTVEPIYPFCAIIKLLIALRQKGVEASLSLKDISQYLIGNKVTGLEPIEYYKNLQPSQMIVDVDLRQFREMVVFISQLSFLKIYNRKIYLDVQSDRDATVILEDLIHPIIITPSADKIEEFMALTSLNIPIIGCRNIFTSDSSLLGLNNLDIEFTEGKRKRVHHLRIERSPILRQIYIRLHPEPVCDACKINIKEKYPWVDYMLDLHHLLPLSSAIKIIETGTTLHDMVGLCPSCHRAIHSYYNKWLKNNSQDDFKSKREAMQVYLDAIREIA